MSQRPSSVRRPVVHQRETQELRKLRRCRLLAPLAIGLLLVSGWNAVAETAPALVERSRRVLVLYGWDVKETEKPGMVPADTMTAELLQTPVEWLGYECDYLHLAEAGSLPADIESRCAAIIVDGETQVPTDKEKAVAEWLAKAKQAQVPVMFLGGVPFASDEACRTLREAFGLRGSLMPTPRVHEVSIASASELMNFEAKAKPSVQGFHDLQGPEDARVDLALTARDEEDRLLRFTPVFRANWGGMWLEPYVTLRASQDSQLFYVDPWKLMANFLAKLGPLPAPDTTTRDGCRMFYSHIDGDGFASIADLKGHPLCAEVLRDRVLKVFPLPVSVSVVEADMRAWSEGIEDDQQPRIAEAARSIFAMPNVQVASHSFSHPYRWHKDDPNPGEFTEENLPLKARAQYAEISAEREIRGSIDYIQKELCPPGKAVELMLWSGNCRPGEKALRLCREMGIANMNGGDTIVSRLYPGIAGIAPRVTPWGSELQINASNQNEFMYSNGWNGPFYGGYARVIDTFERTESPRRVKPVNVYYHFYSAMNFSALRALEKIYHWCEEQPLHPVTALQFATLTKDAYQTKIYQQGARRWIIENEGHLRSYRLPSELGVPDMKRSKGVSGWNTYQGSLYVHTRGGKSVDLVLTDVLVGPPSGVDAHLHLTSSDAELEFETLLPFEAKFATRGLSAGHVELAGLPSRTNCIITINEQLTRASADEHGHLSLTLPATARVVVDASEGRHATAAR